METERKWDPYSLWLQADEAEKDRIVARALRHAFARQYVDLPTFTEWLKAGKFKPVGTVVYFDLLEHLGAGATANASVPDYRITAAVASWLERFPAGRSPDISRVVLSEYGKADYQDDRKLGKAVRGLFPETSVSSGTEGP